jgi:hypothetical protein
MYGREKLSRGHGRSLTLIADPGPGCSSHAPSVQPEEEKKIRKKKVLNDLQGYLPSVT